MTKRKTKRKSKPVNTLDTAKRKAWLDVAAWLLRPASETQAVLPRCGYVQRGKHRWPVNVEDLKIYRKDGFVAVGREGSKMVAHLPEYEF